MLTWETREGEKGQFAEGKRLTYRLRKTRQYTGVTYHLFSREGIFGKWDHEGNFNFRADMMAHIATREGC